MEVLEMRKKYINPEIEMLEFDTKDVITTSGETDLGGVFFSSSSLAVA